MAMFDLIIILILCLVVSIICATLVIALSSSTTVGKRVRRQLASRLEALPFFRMLKKRNVDVTGYLQETPIVVIEQTLQNCEDCPSLKQCDQALAKTDTDQQDYSFCPNDPVIRESKHNEVTDK